VKELGTGWIPPQFAHDSGDGVYQAGIPGQHLRRAQRALLAAVAGGDRPRDENQWPPDAFGDKARIAAGGALGPSRDAMTLPAQGQRIQDGYRLLARVPQAREPFHGLKGRRREAEDTAGLE
jgi:hypothetical protein